MKRTFRSIATLSLASIVIVSCSPLNKMKKRAGEMGYKVTPEVLEEKVAIDLNAVSYTHLQLLC